MILLRHYLSQMPALKNYIHGDDRLKLDDKSRVLALDWP